MEVREDDENFCSIYSAWELRHCVPALHCIATLFNEYKTLEFIWPLDKVHNFFIEWNNKSRSHNEQ